MTFILLDSVDIYRNISYFYIFRTAASLGIALLFIYLIKDKKALGIAGMSFLIGIAFEAMAVVIGLRTYLPDDMFHFLLLVGLAGLEIGGAAAIVWSVSTVLYKREKNWKIHAAVWAGIIICITIIFPLIMGA